ncbi:MAG TPA: alpha/beta hydrolase [Thermoanaerobaculia bacterium]|nr:alpha/beta hydrolase [Thermoanaerobaculia bacterium]
MSFWKRVIGWTFVFATIPALAGAQGRQQTSSANPPDLLRRSAYLGAALAPPTGSAAGAQVVRVVDGTAAQQAGLKVGDRVLSINGKLLDNGPDFYRTYNALRGGDKARFEILRDGQVFTRDITLPERPKERHEGLDTEYGSVLTDRGHRVRTIVTKPQGATGKLPALLLVNWLSCESAEWPLGANSGHSKLIHGVAKESGFVMMRVDRPGVGDSAGPACADTDFEMELAGWRAALKALKKHPAVDPDRVFLFGVSNGGGVAPLVTQTDPAEKVAGYVVTGGWMKTWLEHMLEHERRRLRLTGSTPAEINERMRGYGELYTLYLERKMTPAEVIRERPHLAPLWYDAPEHQYGRPAAFYHQLQGLNLAAAWDKVDVPVLVIYGEYDWIMSREDHVMIAELVNKNHPGKARYVEVPKMDHLFHLNESQQKSFDDYNSGTFDASLIPLITGWLQQHR